MEASNSSWVSLLMQASPFLLLIGFWIYLMRQLKGPMKERGANVEKQIDFLLEHHARFAADLEELKNDLKLLKDEHRQLANSVGALAGAVTDQHGQVAQLVSITEALARTTQELTNSQRHTNERLNALIKVVDDIVRRDGGRL
jgi:methyl-accepting chemotaxis protein